MPRLKITSNVYKHGVAEYTKDTIVDVDATTAARLERRGQATAKFEEPKEEKPEGDEKKGGKKSASKE